MDTRREFFRKVATSAGGAGLTGALLPSITRAMEIQAAPGSTFLDAEHVVILMQENRSFDHCFGALRGVRGFNDPHAVTLPNGNPVWLQTDGAGNTYAPFRLNTQETKATWLGGLPHSWTDQTDAKNNGDHDKWLVAKPTRAAHCEGMPLTMGYYDRTDLPFYYALADAFTVCDQYFCSSLTGTTPNRLYLWSGTIREEPHAASPAQVRNEYVDYGSPAHWTTFPERLQAANVSWRVYQNELSIPTGLTEEEDAWLSSFTDNPLEWFPQFGVEFAQSFQQNLPKVIASVSASITDLEQKAAMGQDQESQKKLTQQRAFLAQLESAKSAGSPAHSALRSNEQKELHARAFTTNAGDSQYRAVTALEYRDGNETHEMRIPKGDVLHQFRADVQANRLPAVSWIVAPERFSDHPTAPWYGAWYLAEVMNILTEKPDIWKKTIFILTYDENDGFFDHVPPFGSPCPGRPETGAVSEGIDSSQEYWSLAEDQQRATADHARGGSLGLGFRVPMIVASPWSRGGAVCSQVFDHTSILQFLELFASHKSGKQVQETNITQWRRTVCGDLTSIFEPANTARRTALPYPDKDAFLESIHKAQFRVLPAYTPLSKPDIHAARQNLRACSVMPHQEEGTRPARSLPYELYAEGTLSADRTSLAISMSAGSKTFGKRSAGAPFHVYAPAGYHQDGAAARVRSYAVSAGDRLSASWRLDGFTNGRYHLRVCGPNGFLREFAGCANDPSLKTELQYGLDGQVRLIASNRARAGDIRLTVEDQSYGRPLLRRVVPAGSDLAISLDLRHSSRWHDFSVRVEGAPSFLRKYSGHVETGEASTSDPAMASAIPKVAGIETIRMSATEEHMSHTVGRKPEN